MGTKPTDRHYNGTRTPLRDAASRLFSWGTFVDVILMQLGWPRLVRQASRGEGTFSYTSYAVL